MRRGAVRNFCAYLCAILLTGCQSTISTSLDSVDPGQSQEWLSHIDNWQGQSQYLIQLATLVDGYNFQKHVIRYDISLTSEELVMAAQTTLGVPLYESVFRNGVLTVERHVRELEGFNMVQPVADFVLTNWPLPEISNALDNTAYTVESKEDYRVLLDQAGDPLIEVHGTSSGIHGTSEITHHDIPLEIFIQTLERRTIRP